MQLDDAEKDIEYALKNSNKIYEQSKKYENLDNNDYNKEIEFLHRVYDIMLEHSRAILNTFK